MKTVSSYKNLESGLQHVDSIFSTCLCKICRIGSPKAGSATYSLVFTVCQGPFVNVKHDCVNVVIKSSVVQISLGI